MSGLFGIVSINNCISSLYYGTDYHSHLGTEYGGIAFINEKGMPVKKIHDIANSQFKSKFYEGSEKYKKMIDWIAQDLGVTSLRYQLLEDMVKAIGMPGEKLCLYCWTGEDFQKDKN